MNTSTTKILWALVLMMGLVLYLDYRKESLSDLQARKGRPLIADITDNVVSAVEIRRTNSVIKAERRGTGWRLVEPVDYPANDAAIDHFIEDLIGARARAVIDSETIMEQAGGYGGYGLEPPRAVIYLYRGDHREEIRLGDPSLVGDEVYVSVAGREGVNVVGGAWMKRFPDTASVWRDRSLLDLSNVQFDRFSIRKQNRTSIDFQRAGETQPWRVAHPIPVRANSTLVESLIQELQTIPVMEFVAEPPDTRLEEFGLRPPRLEIAFGSGANDLASLAFGNAATNQAAYVYTYRSSHKNVVTAPVELLRAFENPLSHFRDRQLISFRPEQVRQIQIEAGESIKLSRDESNEWGLQSPFSADADDDRVHSLLQALLNARIVEFHQDVAPDLAAYGLDQPSMRVRLLSDPAAAADAGSLLAELDFGRELSDRVLVKRQDEPSVYVVPRAVKESVPHQAFALRDRQLWSFGESNVTRVEVDSGGRRQVFEKTTDGKWSIAEGSMGVVEVAALKSALDKLGRLQAASWTASGGEALAKFGLDDDCHEIVVHWTDANNARQSAVRISKKRSSYYRHYASTTLRGAPVVFEFPIPLYQSLETHLLNAGDEPAASR